MPAAAMPTPTTSGVAIVRAASTIVSNVAC